MTDEEAKALAEKHWEWMRGLLELCGDISQDELAREEYLVVTAMIHMAKHCRENLVPKE